MRSGDSVRIVLRQLSSPPSSRPLRVGASGWRTQAWAAVSACPAAHAHFAAAAAAAAARSRQARLGGAQDHTRSTGGRVLLPLPAELLLPLVQRDGRRRGVAGAGLGAGGDIAGHHQRAGVADGHRRRPPPPQIPPTASGGKLRAPSSFSASQWCEILAPPSPTMIWSGRSRSGGVGNPGGVYVQGPNPPTVPAAAPSAADAEAAPLVSSPLSAPPRPAAPDTFTSSSSPILPLKLPRRYLSPPPPSPPSPPGSDISPMPTPSLPPQN